LNRAGLGDGFAKLLDDGSIEIEFAYHNGDEAVLKPDDALGAAAISCIETAPVREGSPFVFPADWGDGHFIGVVRPLTRVCAKANLKDATPHGLRYTFASVAGDLGFSELTIAGLLDHSARALRKAMSTWMLHWSSPRIALWSGSTGCWTAYLQALGRRSGDSSALAA
jgi:integrase